MTESAPLPVFIDHYASGPSGITTYGAHLAAHLPELCRLNLHASTLATLGANCLDVPAERSHDPNHVAGLLTAHLARYADRRVAWLPNVGDVSWAAVWRALVTLTPADRARVRIFGIVHGDQEAQYQAMRRYAPVIAGLAGVSQRCVDTLRASMPPTAPTVELLHYPVSIPERPAESGGDGPLRLLYAGRFEESQKRVSRLPELFARLAAAGIPFTATLAGDGPAREAIDARIAALPQPVAARIRCLGPVARERMTGLLRSHDVLLLVSAFEGTPLVLLEAMAHGLCPVLMQLAGDLSGLLVPGENACVVPQENLDAMVDAIVALDRDRVFLGRLKASARAALETRADPATHARWLLERLSRLWSGPTPNPDLVTDPDPLGRRIDRMIGVASAATPASVGVWGAGVVGRQVVDRLLTTGIVPAVMVDTDAARHGTYRGVTVTAPAVLAGVRPDIVCVGSIAFAEEIVAAMRQLTASSRVLVP